MRSMREYSDSDEIAGLLKKKKNMMMMTQNS